MRRWLVCAATLAAAPGAVWADDNGGGKVESQSNVAVPASSRPHFGFSVAGAYEFGGDDLATVYFNDGSTENLRAGQGLLIAVGGNYRPSRYSPWAATLMAGYKFDHAGASNGDLSFDRIPVELIGSYEWSNGIRLGLGPVYHTNVKFKGSGDLSGAPSVNFKDAFGGQVQAGWKFIALTYTAIRYKDDFGDSVSGNDWGIRFIWNF